MTGKFRDKVAASGFTLPAAAVLATLLWCAEGIFTPNRLWGWAACGLTAYVWTETDNVHSLIRIRSLLTPSVYLLTAGCIFSLHPLQDGLVASCLMAASYYLLFMSYQRTEAASPLFHSFLCLGIGSLLFPQLLFFAPFYLWYAAAYLRSLAWRTFWAAAVGLALPYWFAAGYCLCAGDFDWFAAHFRDLALVRPVHRGDYLLPGLLQIGAAGLVTAFSVVAALHCAFTGFDDKMRTRMFMNLILAQELLIVAFMALQPVHFQVLLCLLAMNSAPILSHYFALAGGRFADVAFALFLSLSAALSLLNVLNAWTRWLIF